MCVCVSVRGVLDTAKPQQTEILKLNFLFSSHAVFIHICK